MRYKLKVKAKASWSQPRRNTMVEAFCFAANTLSLQNLGLARSGSRMMVRLIDNPDCGGFCVQKRNGDIVVAVCATDDQDLDYEVEALFHELTHAHQFLTGALRDEFDENENLVCYWHGKPYKMKGHDMGEADESNDAYWNSPWEVEARKVASDLKYAWDRR